MPDIRSFSNRTLILLSNREPYEHRHGEMGIDVRRPPGGLVTALDPTMQATDGVWVAWGSGSADAETADHEGRLRVPPGEDGFTLRRVFLTDAEVDGYYMGFSNRSLWPLCHMLVQHFEYRTDYWNMYQEVNSKFAHAVADEVRRSPQKPIVWIQDYHFALAAEMLRELATPALIHQCWHIPFPPADILRLLPTGVDERVQAFHFRRAKADGQAELAHAAVRARDPEVLEGMICRTRLHRADPGHSRHSLFCRTLRQALRQVKLGGAQDLRWRPGGAWRVGARCAPTSPGASRMRTADAGPCR